MKNNLYIITIEPLEKRYSKQWFSYFKEEFGKDFNVKYVDGNYLDETITNGKFLDINKTNLYKGQQVEALSKLFMENKIVNSDSFLFCDGWHPGIINLKYMIDLNGLKCKIYSYWHAGSWDNHDFVTQAGFRKWAKGAEESMLLACEKNFVATKFHKKLISDYFKNSKIKKSLEVVGFPMDWEKEVSIITNKGVDKKPNIVFPHRLDKEKQPQVFDSLHKRLPYYNFIKTMEVTHNKTEYYNLLNESKVMFSASLQETYGIGTVESVMLNVIPLVPDRLSYSEMYPKYFKYKTLKEAMDKLERFMLNANVKKTEKLMEKLKNKLALDSACSISFMCSIIKGDRK